MYGLRLISQSNMLNVPYEVFTIYISQTSDNLYAINAQANGLTYRLAYYSTKEKAMKVMERIIDFPGDVFYLPLDEEVEV